MLRILTLLIITYSLVSSAYGQNIFLDRPASFFLKDPDKKPCSKCQENKTIPKNTKIDVESLKKEGIIVPVESIKSISMFIDTNCKFTNNALRDFQQFAQDTKDWKIDVFVSGNFNEFMSLVSKNKDFLKFGVVINFDYLDKKTQENNVTETPTFIIRSNTKILKIAGQPDLKEIIKSL